MSGFINNNKAFGSHRRFHDGVAQAGTFLLTFLGAFFRRPHQITKPVTGNEAQIRLAQNMSILPGKPRIAPVWMS
jgi:hypothetical protein